MPSTHYLTTQEVCVELGITAPTLYAYVSRGLIRSESAGGKTRARRYAKEDVQRLKERKELRRDPATLTKLTAEALHWGTTLLDSAITLIDAGNLFYRGYNVADLVKAYDVEAVVGLIWLENVEAGRNGLFSASPLSLSKTIRAVARTAQALPPLERFQAVLPFIAQEDLRAYDIRPQAVARAGARLLQYLALVATEQERTQASLAQTLQQGWAPNDSRAVALFTLALILCADHELNVSSFTARCVASAQATLYSAVLAGLSALLGVRHGGQTGQVEAFLREVQTPKRARTVLADRLRRGEAIPGFGHRLYPEGDPRARLLLKQLGKRYAGSPALALATGVVSQAHKMTGEHPTIDFALVALANALQLASGSALTIFALGRTIGWTGHAIEQYKADRLIRPRAQYIGKVPV